MRRRREQQEGQREHPEALKGKRQATAMEVWWGIDAPAPRRPPPAPQASSYSPAMSRQGRENRAFGWPLATECNDTPSGRGAAGLPRHRWQPSALRNRPDEADHVLADTRRDQHEKDLKPKVPVLELELCGRRRLLWEKSSDDDHEECGQKANHDRQAEGWGNALPERLQRPYADGNGDVSDADHHRRECEKQRSHQAVARQRERLGRVSY